MSQEEMIAVEAMDTSNLVDPKKSANTNAMFANAIELASSSEGMDEAKAALDASISKMMAEPDPFMQMMIAIYEVIPGTMLYKEEKLIYDTDAFEFVTQLNNHMTKAMSYYSKSADYVAESGAGTPDEAGISTSGASTTWDVWGLAAGDAYLKEMEDLKAIVTASGLPPEIIESMMSAFEKISVADSSSLWNGLAGAYRVTGDDFRETVKCNPNEGETGYWRNEGKVHNGWMTYGTHHWDWVDSRTGEDDCFVKTRKCFTYSLAGACEWSQDANVAGSCTGHKLAGGEGEYGKYKVTVGDSDWVVGYNGNLTDEGYSHSSRRVSAFQGAVDSSTTGNLELQTTINSYSATVEAEFMFDMEQYNTYANTGAKSMSAHIDQVAASSNRLTNISHA